MAGTFPRHLPLKSVVDTPGPAPYLGCTLGLTFSVFPTLQAQRSDDRRRDAEEDLGRLTEELAFITKQLGDKETQVGRAKEMYAVLQGELARALAAEESALARETRGVKALRDAKLKLTNQEYKEKEMQLSMATLEAEKERLERELDAGIGGSGGRGGGRGGKGADGGNGGGPVATAATAAAATAAAKAAVASGFSAEAAAASTASEALLDTMATDEPAPAEEASAEYDAPATGAGATGAAPAAASSPPSAAGSAAAGATEMVGSDAWEAGSANAADSTGGAGGVDHGGDDTQGAAGDVGDAAGAAAARAEAEGLRVREAMPVVCGVHF